MPPRILVLYNEPVLPPDHPDAGSEHDVLDTVSDTVKILKAAGFDTARLGINYDPRPLLAELNRNPPDAVFNLFEGMATRPETEVSAAALLEWLNVPFTGCPSPALALGRDKVRTKHLLAAVGLPTPDYLVIDAPPVPRWRRPWPAIVKPACQDASVGIDQESVVTSQKQLDERVRHVLAVHGPPVLIERFVSGREFHVNMIEDAAAGPGAPPLVLPLAEIEFRDSRQGQWAVYTFTAKWDMDSDEYKLSPLRSPVEIPAADFARLEVIARRSFRELQCRDYARIDVRMAADGKFYVLEVNPNPYLNSLALVNGLAAIGRTHEQLVVDLTLAALARGGKQVPTGMIRVPVGVVVGA
ncbi:MAG: ddl 2 [Gemmataceae bacterium]|nr:ddl 2 [Gemmataceae bacterium]